MTPAPARLWHMPRCLGILWAFTRTTPYLPVSRPRWVDLALMMRIIRHGWVWQIKGAQGVAGFIVRDGGKVHALYVHPSARGQGLGRILLETAKAECDQLQLWVLAANAPARAFYAAQGFQEMLCGRGMGNDENLPDILMIWQADTQDQHNWERGAA